MSPLCLRLVESGVEIMSNIAEDLSGQYREQITALTKLQEKLQKEYDRERDTNKLRKLQKRITILQDELNELYRNLRAILKYRK